MRRTSIVTLCASLLLAAAGCSSDGALNPSGDDDDDDDGSSGNAFHFEGGNFTVPVGEEFYHCYFRDFATGAEPGLEVGAVKFAYTPGSLALHHIVIFSADSSEGNTDRDCELLENGWNPRYAGGTQTDPLEMPAGVAMPVDATEHIVIQFHYSNAGEAAIVDNTTVDIDYTTPGTSFIDASLIVSGQTDFEVPAGMQAFDVVGECTVPQQLPFDINVFAIWPHMHQSGTWFRIDATLNGVDQVLWDAGWNFGDQPLSRLDTPLQVGAGDSITTTCTYNNPDEVNPITYGESSNQEMCFDFFFYYPAIATQTVPCITN